jgi:hypothetical protein
MATLISKGMFAGRGPRRRPTLPTALPASRTRPLPPSRGLLKLLVRLAGVATALALVGAGAATIASASPPDSPNLPTITITMDPTSITVGGELESGAVDIRSTTTGKPVSSPALIRLDPGVTADQALALMAVSWDPNDVGLFGAGVFNVWVADGTTNDTQTILQPGDYLAIDSGGYDPSKFTTTSFTIAAATEPAELPAAQASIWALDFGFGGASTLRHGQLVRVENRGYLVHEIGILRYSDVPTARRAMALMRAGREAKAETFAKEIVILAFPVSHGAVQQSALKARPGIWVLACGEQTQDHRMHTQLGMARLIHIIR